MLKIHPSPSVRPLYAIFFPLRPPFDLGWTTICVVWNEPSPTIGRAGSLCVARLPQRGCRPAASPQPGGAHIGAAVLSAVWQEWAV